MQSACLSYDISYLQTKVSPSKIAMGEILRKKLIAWGVGIRISWVGDF